VSGGPQTGVRRYSKMMLTDFGKLFVTACIPAEGFEKHRSQKNGEPVFRTRPLSVSSHGHPSLVAVRSRSPAQGRRNGMASCFRIIKDGSQVRLYSRHGTEYTDRLPGMVAAFAKLPTSAAILDGELVLIDPRGAAHFYRLMAQMPTSEPDESQLMFLAFGRNNNGAIRTLFPLGGFHHPSHSGRRGGHPA
jgi:ATP dependent DNA ligase domain